MANKKELIIVGAATASAVVGYYFYDKKKKADTSDLKQTRKPAELTIKPPYIPPYGAPYVNVEDESKNASIGKTPTNSVNSQARDALDANKIKVPEVKQEDNSVSRNNKKEEDVKKDGK